MSQISYEAFFKSVTGLDPFPYQVRLAESEDLPAVVNVPTGTGKTAAIVVAWLWRRRFAVGDRGAGAPRRLVYCLPMRILVEQTRDVVLGYLDRLDLHGASRIPVRTLMGGDADDEWLMHPESEAVLIGTQDMLLSAALNRGYGLRRFRWPQAFGLLHSDALWVFDEIQLFGAGLPTTAQLEGMRKEWGTAFPTKSIWMSATLQRKWLATVDHPAPGLSDVVTLDANDLAPQQVLFRRLHAPKRLEALAVGPAGKDPQYVKKLAAQIVAVHRPGTLTLVIVNTVNRARALHEELASGTADTLLLHSRFRPAERETLLARLLEPVDDDGPGRIVVSTQVIEAGVDISAQTLITELAPWSALVQRFGRCNRYAESADSKVYWVDLEEVRSAPYEQDDLAESRSALAALQGRSVAPSDLPLIDLAQPQSEVIRRRDVVDLFDTAPDLSGTDVDVSRYIRNQGDQDLHVFWRDLPQGAAPSSDIAAPARGELCPAPVGELRTFLATRQGWIWDHLSGTWRQVHPNDLRPGVTILLAAASGGYSPSRGWDPDGTVPVVPASQTAPSDKNSDTLSNPEEAVGDDLNSTAAWQTLVEHTDAVFETLNRMLDHLPLEEAESLRLAARWHDAGKSHPVFQATLTAGDLARCDAIWAKSPNRRHHARPPFRHELASALALQQETPRTPFLAVYLVASHHGRARLAIRSLDGEHSAPNNRRFALGIWEGDQLPEAELGSGVSMSESTLRLSAMEIGQSEDGDPSWTEQALALLHTLGPFRLAFLESVLRAADSVASRQGRKV